jgi:hypothetical protein
LLDHLLAVNHATLGVAPAAAVEALRSFMMSHFLTRRAVEIAGETKVPWRQVTAKSRAPESEIICEKESCRF